MKLIVKENDFNFDKYQRVKVSYQGNVTKVVNCSVAHEMKIKMLNVTEKVAYDLEPSKKYFMLLESGEIKECNVSESRDENYAGFFATLDKLKGIINRNVTDPTRVHWLTLTYAQPDGKPMTDVKRLRLDFQQCMRALRADYPNRKIEFIRVYEPQGSGAWHLHVILIWDGKRPYINSNVFRRKYWNHGFVTLQGVDKNCDNIGEYFGVYLTDVSVDELEDTENIEVVERKGKKYAKGARLKYYPSGTNFYGTSRGIVSPEEEETCYGQLDTNAFGQLTYKEKRYFLLDNGNVIIYEYEYYNKARGRVKSERKGLFSKIRDKLRKQKRG